MFIANCNIKYIIIILNNLNKLNICFIYILIKKMSIKNPFILVLLLISIVNVLSVKARYLVSKQDLSKTSNKFSAFTIDFIGIDTPDQTYWGLLYWQMDLTKLKQTYSDANGGDAYGGLQTTPNGRTAIMSFWQVNYQEFGKDIKLRATRIYPKGDESIFTNEGEGTNYINKYNWPTNVWHRFTIYSWDDYSTGNTFVGEWIQNLSTKEWTLFTYFDTKLKSSYITGPLKQFQENYNAKTFGQERSSRFKNIYALDKTTKNWVSLDKSTLDVYWSANNGNTAGTSEYGFTYNYFYMSSGLPVDDQKKYDANIVPITGTITQPDSPDFTQPSVKSLDVTLTTSKMTINWSMDSKTSPCFEYILNIYSYNQPEYSLIKSVKITRPEEKTYSFNSVFKGQYSIDFRCNSISNSYVRKNIKKTI